MPEGRETVHRDAEYRARTGKLIEHFVTVLPGDSLMSRVFGEGRLKVNSSHTLRCETVAPGFRATALSEDDDIVEAIEHETLPIYGFQFHPEYYWGETRSSWSWSRRRWRDSCPYKAYFVNLSPSIDPMGNKARHRNLKGRNLP